MNSTTNATASAKTHGKFKFNQKSSAAKPVADLKPKSTSNADKVGTITEHNISTASNASDCMIIDDDPHGFTTAKSLVSKEAEEDIFFDDFNADDLTFTKITTQIKNDTRMEDLYAKYGSPKPKSASAFDVLDIDKQLNSNASYVSAIKKLDENMQKLRASPMKKPPATASKFKYNVKSNASTAAAQSISPPAVAKPSGFDTNFKAMGMTNQMSKPSAAPTNNTTFKPSTITANITSNKTSSNSLASLSASSSSSFDAPVSRPYKATTPVQSQIESSLKTGNSSP